MEIYFLLLISGAIIGSIATVLVVRKGALFEKESLRHINEQLESRVAERTARLQQTNDRLQQSAKDIEDLYNNAPCGYHSLDPAGTIVRINNTELNWLGYSREELLNRKKFSDLLTPESLRIFQANYPKFKQQGSVSDLEFEMVRKDGSVLSVNLNATAIRDPAGNHLMSRSTLVDMTDRKQAEAERREMLVALENAVSGISRLDSQGCYIVVNQAYASAGGYLPAEMIGMEWQRTVHPDDLEKVVAAYDQMLQDGKVEVEAKGIRKDGSLFHKRLVMITIYDERHQFVGHHCFMKDITDRKQAETSLTHLAGIVECSGDAIISKTLDGTILSWNNAATKIFGYEADEVIGQSIALLIPSNLSHEEQQILEIIRRGEIVDQYETVRVRKDGQQIYISVTVSPLKDSTGRIIGASATKRDISNRKQAENEHKRIEIALRNSEEQFRHAFEDASIGMAIVSLDGHWLKVNLALCEIIGYTVDELLSLTFQDITHPDDLATDLSYAHQLLAGEISTYQLEKRYLHKQGHTVWILLNGSLVQDEQDNPLHFIAQIQDITLRKQTEVALQESEARYRAIIQDQTELICRFLPDSTILFVNEAYCRYFGLKPDEVIGKTYQPILFKDDQEQVAQLIRSMNRNNPTVLIENRVVVKGQVRWTQWSNRMLFNQQGNFIEYQSVGRDITNLKQAELERQAVSDRLHFLLNYSPVVIFSSKPDGDYGATFISENIKDILGYEARAFLENSNFWANHLHPDDVERVLNGLATLFVDDFYVHEYRLRQSNGAYCWLLAQLRLIRDQVGRPVEILGYLVDISDRKRIEAERQQQSSDLQQAKEAAEAANHSKSTFLSNMSHELRTPLNIILGFAQMMITDTTLSAPQKDYIRIMHRSGDHLLHLINDILDLSKIEAGRITLDNITIDLLRLLDDLRSMFQGQADDKNLQFTLELTPGIPQYIVTDPNKLRQVLINLLNNAIKFTKQGGVTLRVAAVKSQAEKQMTNDEKQMMLQIEVEDTGVGIAPEELPAIFDAFTQAEAGQISVEGTGLGLTINRSIVNLMGGDLTVRSILRQGSTFSFSVPFRYSSAVSVPIVANPGSVIGLAAGQTNRRILVVEDHLDSRQLMVKLLTQVGLEVQAVSNGVDAIACWQQWHPHLIWMDIRMPGIDGFEATKSIRAEESLRNAQQSLTDSHAQSLPGKKTLTKIIALTAQPSTSDLAHSLAAGCDDFVSKPIQVAVLFTKMADHLGLRYRYEEPSHPVSHPSPSRSSFRLTPQILLQIMPPKWIAALYQAALFCDEEETSSLIQQIPAEHTVLIDGLNCLLRDYRFEVMVQLTQPGDSSTL